MMKYICMASFSQFSHPSFSAWGDDYEEQTGQGGSSLAKLGAVSHTSILSFWHFRNAFRIS